MGFGLPGWLLGFVIALALIAIAKNLVRGAGVGIGRFSARRNQEDLEDRLADVERAQQRQLESGATGDLERRVSELEDRLDFAERQLARQHEAERLAPPRH
ncbi:MAG TPA: hypothetical protein VJN62_02355 [Gemmatimonadales bacterium]|nr:hypothetical protein [Gemmatimonadales bacterium]